MKIIMTKSSVFKQNIFVFGIPLLLIATIILIAKSSIFSSNTSLLSNAITIDILLAIPFIYFLLIRKKNISKLTVVPLFVIGIIIASYIIPKEHQSLLSIVKTWMLPIVELSVISFIIFKIRKIITHFKKNTNNSLDFYTTLKNTCNETFPKTLAILMTTEIAVIYYGFINRKKEKLKNNEYSYHKESGVTTILFALIFVIAIETVAFHLLLAKWNIVVAWILTGLSIYTGFQIFGFLRSMSKRPFKIKNNTLYLNHGIMTETKILISNIETLEVLGIKDIELDKETKYLSLFGSLENPNLKIKLKKQQQLQGLYGTTKTYKTLLLHVDEKVRFKKHVESLLEENHTF